jgi:hypothetical protein
MQESREAQQSGDAERVVLIQINPAPTLPRPRNASEGVTADRYPWLGQHSRTVFLTMAIDVLHNVGTSRRARMPTKAAAYV